MSGPSPPGRGEKVSGLLPPERGEAVAGRLQVQVLRLVRALRRAGLPLGPGDAQAALQAVQAVDLGDRSEVCLALRLVLCRSRAHQELFGPLFDLYFGPGADARRLQGVAPLGGPLRRRHAAAAGTHQLERWRRAGGEAAPTAALPVASSLDTERETLLETLLAAGDDAVRRAVQRVARRLASRPGRRYKLTLRGRRLALRASLRASVSAGGELARLQYRQRRLRRQRLVLACDVSGSMALYSRFLFQVAHALQRHVGGVESFAFSTRLIRVTEPLRQGDFAAALRRAGLGREWGGGTRIGHSLLQLLERHGARLGRRTTLIILSDGWDAGEPAELTRALRGLRRRVQRLIWLNPLMGSPDYRPVARGMAAALPYLDTLAPCHNLESLERLARYLASGGAPRARRRLSP